MSTATSVASWDGARATECGTTGCSAAPIMHFEVSIRDCDYVAEFDMCADHVAEVGVQARAFLVAMGGAEPADEAERNLRAAAEEHVADFRAVLDAPGEATA